MPARVDVTLDVETVKQNPVCEEILQVLKTVRPEWQIGNIEQMILTGGITNHLFAYYIEGKFDEDVVLLRIEGVGTDQMANRKQEREILQTLYAAGLGPPLYCVFNNGMAYGYIHGETLNVDTEREETVRLSIAKEMARLHAVCLPGIERKPDGVKTLMFKLMDMAPDGFPDNVEKHKRYTENLPPKAELKQELEQLWDHLATLGSPVVFCHNDLVPDNVIYNRDKGCVHFIDFEWSMYNYEHFDLGMHFIEYTGLHNRDLTRYPDKSYQLEWIRYYLECKAGIDMGSPGNVTERDVMECYDKVNKFALLCYLMSGVWGLVQSRFSALDFDYLGFAIERIAEYFKKKEKFLAL